VVRGGFPKALLPVDVSKYSLRGIDEYKGSPSETKGWREACVRHFNGKSKHLTPATFTTHSPFIPFSTHAALSFIHTYTHILGNHLIYKVFFCLLLHISLQENPMMSLVSLNRLVPTQLFPIKYYIMFRTTQLLL